MILWLHDAEYQCPSCHTSLPDGLMNDDGIFVRVIFIKDVDANCERFQCISKRKKDSSTTSMYLQTNMMIP